MASPMTVPAQMADVHFLGQVGMRVVEYDLLRRVLGHAESRIGQRVPQLRGQPLALELDIDKARASNIYGRGHILQIQFLHDLSGERAGIGLQLLGRGHHAVGLVVAEFRTSSRTDKSRGIRGRTRSGQCRANARF